MKKIMFVILVGFAVLLCGCQRTIQTDLILFCRAFNEKSDMLKLHEENAFQRTDTEYMLYAGNILIRLCTDTSQDIHTVVLTAKQEQLQTLREAAACAMDSLAEPYAETVPQEFLALIQTGTEKVSRCETENFLYLLYRSAGSVTVQQINLRLLAIPSLPELHSAAAPPSSAENVSQSR